MYISAVGLPYGPFSNTFTPRHHTVIGVVVHIQCASVELGLDLHNILLWVFAHNNNSI